jgi:hypothetical protein
MLFTRKTPQDKCTTTGLLSNKPKGSLIFSQSQNQFTMAFLSQLLESEIKIFMIPPEAMPSTKNQSNHFTLTRAKFNMDTTKLREILNQANKIGLLKILNPTTVSIQIHQVLIRPTFTKARTPFLNIPDLNQGFHRQCSHKSLSLNQIFLYIIKKSKITQENPSHNLIPELQSMKQSHRLISKKMMRKGFTLLRYFLW